MVKTKGSNWEGKRIVCLNPYKKSYLIAWDFEEMEDGSFEYAEKVFDKLPSLEEIKREIIAYYNKKCDDEILSGLTYEGSLVWLSSENQFNYKAAFDFAVQTGGANLPVKIKLGTDSEVIYKIFDTIESFQVFVVVLMSHINNTLAKYWDIKDRIDWSKYDIQSS